MYGCTHLSWWGIRIFSMPLHNTFDLMHKYKYACDNADIFPCDNVCSHCLSLVTCSLKQLYYLHNCSVPVCINNRTKRMCLIITGTVGTYIIIIIVTDWQFMAMREWSTIYQSEHTSPTKLTYSICIYILMWGILMNSCEVLFSIRYYNEFQWSSRTIKLFLSELPA